MKRAAIAGMSIVLVGLALAGRGSAANRPGERPHGEMAGPLEL